jgi:hypothetical protein
MEINKMFDFVPDTQRIAEVFSQALAHLFSGCCGRVYFADDCKVVGCRGPHKVSERNT